MLDDIEEVERELEMEDKGEKRRAEEREMSRKLKHEKMKQRKAETFGRPERTDTPREQNAKKREEEPPPRAKAAPYPDKRNKGKYYRK